jgi:hypothetical protein
VKSFQLVSFTISSNLCRDHREYYNNVKPKVISRWEDGTPKIRNGKILKNRRRTETCLTSNQAQQFMHSTNSANAIHEMNEDEVFNTSQPKDANESADKSISSAIESLNISVSMDVVSTHFKDLFSQLDSYVTTKATTVMEKAFVESQMKILKAHANQIDFMINELVERGNRLEKFLENRHSNRDWSEWK